MNGRTIFRAYQLCEMYKNVVALRRKNGTLGIMVDKDRAALEYQRLNRQFHKFEGRIFAILDRRSHDPL